MNSNLRLNLNQYVAVAIIPLLCIVAVASLQLPQLNRLTQKTKTATQESLKQDLELEKLRLNTLHKTPTFGFNNLVADWVFLNFLQYFGDDEARAVTGYDISPKYFEIIVDRDPKFLGTYLGLSTSISMYAAMPEKSVALMEKGLKSMSPQTPSKSYYIWRYKGIDELLFLGDAKAAKQSFEKAAEWASTYPDEESQYIAGLSRKTAEFLSRNPNSKLAQVNAWAMVLSNTADARTRKIAISRIESLGGKVIVTPEGAVKIRPPSKD